jgi:hypothetical protein
VEAFIAQAKSEFEQAKQGLLLALDTTAEERLDWKPSETARSPVEVAAHAAIAIESMLGNLRGDTFALATPQEADRYFLEKEKGARRGWVVEVLERNSEMYYLWLDYLPESSDLDWGDVEMPFGMGWVPMRTAIGFMAAHLNWHTAQIQYIQTIYGDRETHL